MSPRISSANHKNCDSIAFLDFDVIYKIKIDSRSDDLLNTYCDLCLLISVIMFQHSDKSNKQHSLKISFPFSRSLRSVKFVCRPSVRLVLVEARSHWFVCCHSFGVCKVCVAFRCINKDTPL